MKTKIPHLILALGIFAAQPASAADVLLSFSTFDADGAQTGYQLDGVNQGPATSLVSSFGDPTTYSFTLVNDLDGGGINDTLTFDFVYTVYTGSTYDGNDVTLGTTQTIASPGTPHYGQWPTGDPNTNTMQPGDSFRLSIQNISYTDGEGDSNIARFLGFQQFTKFGGGVGDLLLGTTGYTTLSVGASTSSVVEFNPGGYVSGDLVLTTESLVDTNQRFRDLHFDFEVVPEPSSTALLGLGGLALMLRRKR